MTKLNVLFIDTVHPCLQEELERLNYQCDTFAGSGKKEIISIINNYHGIVIRSKIRLDRAILEKATNLKFIARAGAGMENIDVEYAESKGITCINAPEGNKDAVAEHAMGMLLSLFNNLNRADNQVRKGKWNRELNRGIELSGKTVGIIGYGNIGSAFSKRLQGFDVKILAYDKYKTNYIKPLNFQVSDIKSRIIETTFENIFEKTDILSLHVPLTEETKYMVNDEFIKKFKKNIYLINTSRGKIVKTADLVKNMQSGKILGACLDVLEHESASFEDLNRVGVWFNKRGIWINKLGAKLHKIGLWQHAHPVEFLTWSDKVILSPHIAGWTVESYEKISRILAEKIKLLNFT
ncbi:MAG: NAD(P)-dependent oxidoreductase [Bacteroidota bacterium]